MKCFEGYVVGSIGFRIANQDLRVFWNTDIQCLALPLFRSGSLGPAYQA